MMKFNEKLKQLIYEAGYKGKLKEFAFKAGASKEGTNPASLISQYISGSKIPPIPTLKRIAIALDLTPLELIMDTDYPHTVEQINSKKDLQILIETKVSKMEKEIRNINLVLIKIDKIINKLWPDL